MVDPVRKSFNVAGVSIGGGPFSWFLDIVDDVDDDDLMDELNKGIFMFV